jgi:hypothetical protein
VNWIIAEWPSFETRSAACSAASGDFTSVTWGNAASVRSVSVIAARKAGALTFSVFDWSRTSSICSATLSPFASLLKPASSMMRSAVRDSPTLLLFSSMDVVPICIPMAKATRTKATQPKTAVFQWVELQRPMRAARFFECLRGVISIPF